MNNVFKKNILNLFIIVLAGAQGFMYYYDNKSSSTAYSQKSISVTNFSSIVLSNSGLNKIGSEKLNKIEENYFFLQGQSYLENSKYKIYGVDISINITSGISQSAMPVKVINSMGALNANGFKNIDSQGKIYFDGPVKFISNE